MNTLIGNEKAYHALAASVHSGRLPHALLVEGPEGCGKFTFAREAAGAALCTALRPSRPCGQCRDCIKADKQIHPDILVYGGEGGARSFHIDTVRALRQEAFVMPGEAEYKVLILRDVQQMSVQAQNALLKILEEPPASVYFVLTCENKAALLDTILSRVTVLSLALPTVEQCREELTRRLPDTPPEEVAAAAQQTAGNVGNALVLLAGDTTTGASPAAAILFDACIGSELDALAALLPYERDRPGLTALLEQMATLTRELLLHPPADDQLAQLVTRAGRLRLLHILAIIEDTTVAVSQNVSGVLLTTALCGRIRSQLAD